MTDVIGRRIKRNYHTEGKIMRVQFWLDEFNRNSGNGVEFREEQANKVLAAFDKAFSELSPNSDKNHFDKEE